MTTTSNFRLYFALKLYQFTSLFVSSVLTTLVFHVLCIPEPFFLLPSIVSSLDEMVHMTE